MPHLKFYGIVNVLKNVCGRFNFRKMWAISLKMHTNIIHRLRTFGIEFEQNRLKRSNFLRFWIFWKFSLNCVTYANFELLSSKFVYDALILSDVSYEIKWESVEAFYFLTNSNFLIFFIAISNLKISMYPQSFLCEEAKIKQQTFSKEELCEIGDEAMWESRFTRFFLVYISLFICLLCA